MENNRMTEAEFTSFLKQLRTMYPTVITDELAASMWYRALKDIPYTLLEHALLVHIQSSVYPPTVAELRKAAARLTPHETQLSDMEAWGLVMKAVRRASYYAEEEFAKLPAMVQKAVGDPVNLREWAIMPAEEVQSVGQSQFLRSYRAIQQREEADAGLSPALQMLLHMANGEDQKAIENKGENT